MTNISGCVHCTTYIPVQTSTDQYSPLQPSAVQYSPVQSNTAPNIPVAAQNIKVQAVILVVTPAIESVLRLVEFGMVQIKLHLFKDIYCHQHTFKCLSRK